MEKGKQRYRKMPERKGQIGGDNARANAINPFPFN